MKYAKFFALAKKLGDSFKERSIGSTNQENNNTAIDTFLMVGK